MGASNIEWLINPDGSKGHVWNPVDGCTKVSAGCKNCYAESIAKRFWGDRKFTDVQCHENRLDQPLKRKKPTRYFVNSMSDLFHEGVPFSFVDNVFAIMALCPQHEFIVLTKRPNRMLQYMTCLRNGKYLTKDNLNLIYGRPWRAMPFLPLKHTPLNTQDFLHWPLPNVMLGVSVENQATADERIPILLQTPAAKRFVSYEPALGDVDFRWLKGISRDRPTNQFQALMDLDLLIMGGESGPGYRPMGTDWARFTRDQCKAAGVPFFFKQTAGKGPIPDDLQIREWPDQ